MENEEFEPSKSLYYNYGVKHILTKNANNIKNVEDYININLCVYNVNQTGKYPFIQYLLSNTSYNTLSLPKLPKYTFFNNESLVPYSKVFLSGILQINNFDVFKNEIIFDGFYEYEHDLYLFFDITNCEISLDEIYLSSPVRFALIDEIINHKKVVNIPIDTNTLYFIINNESMCYLYNEKNKPYETPIVGYIGKETENKLKFASMFGESAKDKLSLFGPYFYFTNFSNSIKKCTNFNDMEFNKGGIVRFALFIGTTKYVENIPNSPNDESLIKKQRLEDETIDKKNELLTLRISDHDGLWAEKFDSVFLNDLELDDGSFLPDVPILALKEYNQQIPLSYHYVNKKTTNKEYAIL